MKIFNVLTFVLGTCAFSTVAMASADQKLAEHFLLKISQVNEAFVTATPQAEDSMNIEFKQAFLTLSPSASFGLSGVLGLEIAPEVTFEWEKVSDWQD